MLFDLLKSRRSERLYLQKEIEKEKVDIILKSALLSPSSKASRPWDFIVVTNQDLLGKLAQCKPTGAGFLSKAALGIVVIANTQAGDMWIEDTSIAALSMQLAAHSMGLGSCWIQVRGRFHTETIKAEDYVKELLGIPEQYAVECMLSIGYLAEQGKAPKDEGELFYERLHLNGFGNGYRI